MTFDTAQHCRDVIVGILLEQKNWRMKPENLVCRMEALDWHTSQVRSAVTTLLDERRLTLTEDRKYKLV